MRLLILFLSLVIIISCKPKQSNSQEANSKSIGLKVEGKIVDSLTASHEANSKSVGFEVQERIIDSLSLGESGKFKIEIQQIRTDTGAVFVEFELFEKQNNKWNKKQT